MAGQIAARPSGFVLQDRRVWIAGHRGMVGSALVRRLTAARAQILTVGRGELDLTRQADVEAWLADRRPDAVVIAGAKVGGIYANSSYPVDFLRDNLAIETNIIHGSYLAGVGKLLSLGSSCIYPRMAAQPIKEESLLTGPLEPTNEWYAVAKIAGIKLCQAYRRQYGCDFVSLMPTNLYGPGDNYDPLTSHVPAALIRRFHEAKVKGADEAILWGSGAPLREFMFVDDLADASAFVLEHYSGEAFLNVGTGQDLSIAAFAAIVADVVGFRGRIVNDLSKPDGSPRKLLDVSCLRDLGWRARTPLREGLEITYADFLAGGGRNR